jgi:hypothetical protein
LFFAWQLHVHTSFAHAFGCATTAKTTAATLLLALLLPPSPFELLWLHLFRTDSKSLDSFQAPSAIRTATPLITCKAFGWLHDRFGDRLAAYTDAHCIVWQPRRSDHPHPNTQLLRYLV